MGGGPTETWVYTYYASYPYYPYAAVGPIFRGTFVRSVLLFLVPAKHPLSWQASYFRQRQSGVLPVRHIALEPIKNSVALLRVRRMSIPAGLINGLPLISTVPRCS